MSMSSESPPIRLHEASKSDKSYTDALDLLETQCLTWSDIVHTESGQVVYLALGSKGGAVTFWGLDISLLYTNPKVGVNRTSFIGSGRLMLGGRWITTMTWKHFKLGSETQSMLFVGTSDGEMRVYRCVEDKQSTLTIPPILCTLMYSAPMSLPGSILAASCPRPVVSETPVYFGNRDR
jgi:hypothetical protein